VAPEGLMTRFTRRPWLVSGVFVAVLAALALFRFWGDPVSWLAAALGAAVVVGFLPGGKQTEKTRGEIPVARGESDVLGEDLHAPLPGVGRTMVVATDVAKGFGGVQALRGVSMTVAEGELVGLVGPNGSGKTTLVNLISGAFQPGSGTIEFDGNQIVGLPPHRIAHLGIARTYQIPRPFTSLTVRDNVAMAIMFGRVPLDLSASRQAAGEYLDLVGLGRLADALPGQVNLHERQLLEMARAIATKPGLLLLDEAMAGLNPVEIDNAVEVVQRIRASGVSIVLVEHLLRVVNQLATRIVVLDQGLVLAEGDPGLVMKDPAVVKAYLGRQADARSD